MPRGKKKSDGGVTAALDEIEKTNQEGDCGLMDDAFAESVKQDQELQALNGQIFSANESLARLICIPMPALAPRFLLKSEGWPLGRFTMIEGFKESCKTSLMNEIGTWHRHLGGIYAVTETEDKDAAPLRDSFFRYDRKAWYHTRAFSQDEWNKSFYHWVDKCGRLWDGYEKEEPVLDAKTGEPTGKTRKVKVPGKGRISPVCLGVDSISAVLIQRFVDEIEKNEGVPSQNYPVGAKMLADFFRTGPKKMADYPISFIAISHLRESAPNPQMPQIRVKYTTGGEAPKYAMTSEIEMVRSKPGQYTRVSRKYGEIFSIDLMMNIRKNSLGPHERVYVEMCWYYDPERLDPLTGEKRQITYFDWHSASIELLKDCMTPGEKGKGMSTKRSAELRELLDLHMEDTHRTVWSKTLGIGEKGRLSYFEAGQVLEHKLQNDPEFALNLYQTLGIRRRRLFKRGVDFRQQMKAYTEDLRRAEELIVVQPIEVPLAGETVNPLDAGTEPAAASLESSGDPLDAPPASSLAS